MFLLKIALRPWRESLSSQLWNVAALGFLLYLSAFLFWLSSSLDPVVQGLQNTQVVTAYLEPAVDRNQQGQILDRIQTELGSSVHRRGEVRYVGAGEFLEQIRNVYPNLSEQLISLGSEMERIIPRYFSISGVLSEDFVRKIQGLEGIETVESSSHRFQNIIGAFQTIRWVSLILSIGVFVAVFSSLLHLSKINHSIQESSLQSMRLLGADGIKVRLPAVISGALVGLAGGMLAGLASLVLGGIFESQLMSYSPVFQEFESRTVLFSFRFSLGLSGIGALLGAITGFMGQSRLERR